MTETQQTMTEFTYATGETDVIGDRFSPSVVLFWLKTSVAASNMRVMYKSPNTLLGVIPLGSSTQTIPLRSIASVDTNTSSTSVASSGAPSSSSPDSRSFRAARLWGSCSSCSRPRTWRTR